MPNTLREQRLAASDALMAQPLTLADTDPIRRVRDFFHVHARTHGTEAPIAVVDESGEPGGHRWMLTSPDLGRLLAAGMPHVTYEGMKALSGRDLITTAEQLHALPVGAVLLDSANVAFQFEAIGAQIAFTPATLGGGPYWRHHDGNMADLLKHAPFRVLYTPEVPHA